MFLESDLAADASTATTTATTAVTTAASTNGNGTTKQRLSTIELTMITGVLVSAVSLALNIYNTMKKATSS